MEMKIHCLHCDSVLRVPEEAAGRLCRCPSCHEKFKIPQPEELLEDTISKWIEDDVDHLLEEQNEQLLRSAELERQAIEEEKQKRLAAASDRLQEVLGTSGVPAGESGSTSSTNPAPVNKLHAATAGATNHSTIKPRSKKARGASGSDENCADADVTDHVGAPGYPNELFPSNHRAYLVVDHCDQQGVTLAFDAEFLTDRGFLTSMPMRCVFTDERDISQLIARPLAFCDRVKAGVISTHQIEASRECRLTRNSTAKQVVASMGVIELLSQPFQHPMPYYISASQTTLSLACWSHSRKSDHGVTAFVQIPEGFYALEWLERVNGICGPEYAKLKHDVELLFGGEWRKLGEDCRRRLAVWCPFEEGERFCHFVSDADFNRHDAGLAGMVLTDRRLVYHKYHKRGQLRYDEGALLVIEPGEHGQAVVSIRSDDPDAGKSKALILRLEDVPRLIAAAESVSLATKVNIENMGMQSDASAQSVAVGESESDADSEADSETSPEEASA